MKYLDLFSGAGGFRSAFEQIPGTECVGHCEIDVHADKSYRALFHTEGEWFCNDARQIDTAGLPDFDLVCGGFPCQSFSIAGHRKGFEDTRGTLFFEIARILGAKKPPFVLLENVPGLLSHDEGRTFAVILGALSRLGYHVEWQVLNSKDFGVPQSRQRVFIVGYLGAGCAGKILPILGTNGASLIQVLGGAQGSRVYDPEGIACTQAAQAGGMGGKTGLYAVGFNRKDGITHGLKEAYALNASNFRGLNRNQSQTAVLKTDDASFIDLCAGNPKLTDTARCVTANYGKTTLCYHKGERSGVLETDGVLLIKEATKCGFKPANIGDTVDCPTPPATPAEAGSVGTSPIPLIREAHKALSHSRGVFASLRLGSVFVCKGIVRIKSTRYLLSPRTRRHISRRATASRST